MGKGTSPSVFVVLNPLWTRCLDRDKGPSDTLSITQAIKAETMEQRKESGFHKVHETGRFYEFGLVVFMALYIKFSTRLLFSSHVH